MALTNQVTEYWYTLQPVHELYGHTLAKDFGPLVLKAVRQKMIEAKWCRTQINSRVGKVKRVFKWGHRNNSCRSRSTRHSRP